MADRLQLSFISARNERIGKLLDGEVKVEGADLVWTNSDPSETFWRQLKFGEFEVCEMSFSSFLIAKSHGDPMVGIPVFPSRRFMHAQLSVNVDSGVEKANDLYGKRIGVGEYQQTASLWMRGVLQHDFGVDQFSVEWWMERSEELSHGGATGFKPMDGIKFNRIPTDKSLATMLTRGELDAAPIGRAFSNREERDRPLDDHPAPRRRVRQGEAALPRPDGRGQAVLRHARLHSGEPLLRHPGRRVREAPVACVQPVRGVRRRQGGVVRRTVEPRAERPHLRASVHGADAPHLRHRPLRLRGQGQREDDSTR